MISITLDSLPHLAVPYLPDWSFGMSTTFSFEVDSAQSLTKRQERRSLGSTLRVRAEYTYHLDLAETAAMRDALRTIQDTKVRVPFWPAVERTTGPWGSRWWLGFDDGATFGKVDNITWDQVATGKRVPTLLGHAEITFRAVTPTMSVVSLSFTESSPDSEALTIASEVFTAGPQVASITRYLFPFRPDWSNQLEFGPVVVDVRRDRISFGRQSSTESYPQVGFRSPQFSFTLNELEAARLVRFFADRKGTVEPFWLPGEFFETALAANSSAASADITVVNAATLANYSYIAMFSEYGQVITRKIISRAGNTLTLDSSPGDLEVDSTGLCSLILVRFDSNDLTLRWNVPKVTAEISFVEVSEEYASPVDDTIQSKLGDLPSKAFVYDIIAGSSELRWTSWDSSVFEPISLDQYDPGDGAHGDITQGSAFETSGTSIRIRYASTNPIAALLRGKATDRIAVTVREVTPTNPWSNEVTVFSGHVVRARFDGAFIDAQVENAGIMLSQNIPRMLLQVGDNNTLFDSRNALVKADWTFSARLTAISGSTLTFDTITWPQGALPTIDDDYFALGYIERPAGPTFERIMIVASTAISGGSITVTLASALDTAPTLPESGWALIPGYDGLPETADTKFGNYETHFGGFPFVPASNPSIVPMKKDSASTGKK